MRNYCTLFDSKYAAFGLSLYRSLKRHEPSFQLFILCLDNKIYEVLSSLKLEHVVLIHQNSVFPKVVDAAREYMTPAQICWLSQPLLCRYVLDSYSVEHVVYMDSDCYFMNPPEPLWTEISNAGTVAATRVPHRFPPSLEYLAKVSGEFCVQFNYFDKSEGAKKVLEQWTVDCLKYNKDAPDIYPGQISLDSWSSVSSDTYAIKDIWAGVAVWNLLNINWGKIEVNPVIFYHFHGLYFLENGKCELGGFKTPKPVVRMIYKPYLKELFEVRDFLTEKFPDVEFLRVRKAHKGSFSGKTRELWVNFKRIVRGTYNIYKIQEIEKL